MWNHDENHMHEKMTVNYEMQVIKTNSYIKGKFLNIGAFICIIWSGIKKKCILSTISSR